MWNARAHEAKRLCLGVKRTLKNGGECKGWSPMIPKCTSPILGVTFIIATLTLGSQPRQGLAKVRAKNELGSHISCSRECKRVRGNEPPHSQVSSQSESWSPDGLPKSSEGNCRGQNPLDWNVLYIIRKILERRCLKWVCMTHLDTSNVSYGQKKGQ
jgi:hypothetical protein